ncbi:hypothetical protein PRUPE_7G258100 [Prunus persica]|uniref:Uncharacterized protein n=1 Tax=Prunus persica TaxID=3760 RepID=M5W754_PRUPE|nr:hypothetical protein PRUPE_7G258100 [Prunus persica]
MENETNKNSPTWTFGHLQFLSSISPNISSLFQRSTSHSHCLAFLYYTLSINSQRIWMRYIFSFHINLPINMPYKQ